MINSTTLLPDCSPPGNFLVDAFVPRKGAEELFEMDDESAAARALSEVRQYLPAMPDPLFTQVYRWHEAVCMLPGGAVRALHDMRERELKNVKGL